MRTIVFYTMLLFAFTDLNAQTPNFRWVKHYTDRAKSNALAFDPLGNIYIGGEWNDYIDFEPGGLTQVDSGHGFFFTKTDPAGNLIWSRVIKKDSLTFGYYEKIYSIASDSLGNLYLTGDFRGSIDFDAGPGVTQLISNGFVDNFLCKYDSSGQFIWANSFEGPAVAVGNVVKVNGAGQVYLCGSFGGVVDFDPGPGTQLISSQGVYDIFVSKFDSFGNLLQVNTFGDTNNDFINAMTVDANGNLFIAGSFKGTIDFDPGPGTANLTATSNYNGFVCKYSDTGTLVFAKQIGATNDCGIGAIEVEQNGNLVIAGGFKGTVDLDPGPGVLNQTSIGSYPDIFIEKLNAGGDLIWAKVIGSIWSKSLNALVIDSTGNIYATGDFAGTADFDPGPGVFTLSGISFTDMFILKLDSSGSFSWAGGIGHNFETEGRAIGINNSEDIYTAGLFHSYPDFDPGPGLHILNNNITSSEMAFLLKLKQCVATTTNVTVAACDAYSISGVMYTSSGSYVQTIIPPGGCDSIINLTLTLNPGTGNATQVGTTMFANQIGAFYQWIDCSTLVPISGATSQTYVASANGVYAVVVSYNGCIDTSNCMIVSGVGISDPEQTILQIYPNPSTGKYRMVLPEGSNSIIPISILVTDLTGQIVYAAEELNNSPLVTLDLSSQSNGLYIVECRCDGKVYRGKLLKE